MEGRFLMTGPPRKGLSSLNFVAANRFLKCSPVRLLSHVVCPLPPWLRRLGGPVRPVRSAGAASKTVIPYWVQTVCQALLLALETQRGEKQTQRPGLRKPLLCARSLALHRSSLRGAREAHGVLSILFPARFSSGRETFSMLLSLTWRPLSSACFQVCRPAGHVLPAVSTVFVKGKSYRVAERLCGFPLLWG